MNEVIKKEIIKAIEEKTIDKIDYAIDLLHAERSKLFREKIHK